MKKAAEITCEAHREAMEQTAPGVTEYEIESVIEHTFRVGGVMAQATPQSSAVERTPPSCTTSRTPMP